LITLALEEAGIATAKRRTGGRRAGWAAAPALLQSKGLQLRTQRDKTRKL